MGWEDPCASAAVGGFGGHSHWYSRTWATRKKGRCPVWGGRQHTGRVGSDEAMVTGSHGVRALSLLSCDRVPWEWSQGWRFNAGQETTDENHFLQQTSQSDKKNPQDLDVTTRSESSRGRVVRHKQKHMLFLHPPCLGPLHIDLNTPWAVRKLGWSPSSPWRRLIPCITNRSDDVIVQRSWLLLTIPLSLTELAKAARWDGKGWWGQSSSYYSSNPVRQRWDLLLVFCTGQIPQTSGQNTY